jgi:hypothetical protein
MSKEIVLDITTGIVVLGSVFGFSHLRKISIKIKQFLHHHKLLNEDKRKPVQSVPGTALQSQQDSRNA